MADLESRLVDRRVFGDAHEDGYDGGDDEEASSPGEGDEVTVIGGDEMISGERALPFTEGERERQRGKHGA